MVRTRTIWTKTSLWRCHHSNHYCFKALREQSFTPKIYIAYRIFMMTKTNISNFTITILIHNISKHHDHRTVRLTLFTSAGITNITLTTCRPLVWTLERSEVLTRMTSHTFPSPCSPALHPGASHKTSWVQPSASVSHSVCPNFFSCKEKGQRNECHLIVSGTRATTSWQGLRQGRVGMMLCWFWCWWWWWWCWWWCWWWWWWCWWCRHTRPYLPIAAIPQSLNIEQNRGLESGAELKSKTFVSFSMLEVDHQRRK